VHSSFERHSKQKTLIPTESYYERDNFEVANFLLQMAFFKEFKSANPYSAWAYHKASNAIENMNESIRDVFRRGKLREIPGVGDDIAKVIEEFLVTGRSERLDNEIDSVSKIPY
jgi:DNA polymerase/3'-5' exonuclease PolX